MNKITRGIHIGKYNAFAHKCAALTAGVHSNAATLRLTHYIKHLTPLVYVQYAWTILESHRIYCHEAKRHLLMADGVTLPIIFTSKDSKYSALSPKSFVLVANSTEGW